MQGVYFQLLVTEESSRQVGLHNAAPLASHLQYLRTEPELNAAPFSSHLQYLKTEPESITPSTFSYLNLTSHGLRKPDPRMPGVCSSTETSTVVTLLPVVGTRW